VNDVTYTVFTVFYGWQGEPQRSCVYRVGDDELMLVCGACGVEIGERQDWEDPESGQTLGQTYCSQCAVELGLSLAEEVTP